MSFNQFTTYVESKPKPLLTVDEVEKVQRQRVANLIGHVFQLTYAALFDALIHEEKRNQCNGCAIHHPSQREHSCVMMDSEDAWMYYRDDVVEKIDLNIVLKTTESVCIALGLKLGKSWEAYVTELPKFPWTSIYLTSLELEGFSEIVQPKQLQDRILYAIYYGPNGIKWKDSSDRDNTENIEPVQCPETIVRKDEEPMELDFVINEIQNKFCM
ncbi:hypothetical protein OS493_032765 [Desmophyllum pertusum]|uniref:Uncharacterized protein n=1 Tax=Desmophyllum pertusum TaxID=174260 RepID=A0A9W9ZKV1_9CNID|nr:hypothetical protein OS493_032765 [Desmophyllum pertusum]